MYIIVKEFARYGNERENNFKNYITNNHDGHYNIISPATQSSTPFWITED